MVQELNTTAGREISGNQQTVRGDGEGNVEKGTNGSSGWQQKASNAIQAARDKAAGLDWRAEVSKRPVALSLGALGVGLLVGYGLAGTMKGRRGTAPSDYDEDLLQPDSAMESGLSSQEETDFGNFSTHGTSRQSSRRNGERGRGSKLYGSIKETRFFGRLQDEAAKIGDQIIGELSDIGQNVLLPALTGKVKATVGAGNAGTADRGRARSGRRRDRRPSSRRIDTRSQTIHRPDKARRYPCGAAPYICPAPHPVLTLHGSWPAIPSSKA